jgi:peptidoglycan/LPS O-acetylase OafA/YrhL
MKLQHFKELDAVRGIAALMIMFFHFFQNLETQNAILISVRKYTIFGQTGVSLFFVLSGFLITRILLNTKQSEFYFKNFYIRRALRIFPLYYLFLIIFYFVAPLFKNTSFVSFSMQVWYWVYLQNIAITFNWGVYGPAHLWSLAVEEHFYLVWPFLIYFFSIKRITNTILFVIFGAILIRLFFVTNNLKIYYFTFSRMDDLAVGALLAILEIKGSLKSGNSKKFILLVCSALGPMFILWTFTSSYVYVFDAIEIVKFTVSSFFYFSLIGLILTIKENSRIRKILRARLFSYTGKISYGLYVFHPTCFGLLSKCYKTGSVFTSFILSYAFCYVVASLSYYFFESKFLLLKKKFEYN